MFKVHAEEGSVNRITKNNAGKLPFKPIRTLGQAVKSLFTAGRRKEK